MAMPNFIILGCPRAGTSSLYRYLKQHPQIFMSPLKEPHFFSYEGEKSPRWGVSDIEAYRALFKGVVDETVIGEASVWYLYSNTAAERIRYHIPEAKLIANLRNPVERAYSQWAYNVRHNREPITDFGLALQAEDRRIRNNELWDFQYLNSGFYCQQIKRFQDAFDSDQLRVYLYEDFKNNPTDMFLDIFSFLGVDDTFMPDMSIRYNASMLLRSRKIEQFWLKKNFAKSILKPLIPDGLRNYVSNYLHNLNSVKLAPLSSEL